MSMATGTRTAAMEATGAEAAMAAVARHDFATALSLFEAVGAGGLTPAQRLGYAETLVMSQRTAEGEAIALAHLSHHGPTAKAFMIAAMACIVTRRFGEGLGHASAAEQLDGSERPTLLAYVALCRLGAIHEAQNALKRIALREPGLNFTSITDLCSLAGLLGELDEIPRLLQGAPPIAAEPGRTRYFVAVPKSGGATVANSIAGRIGAQFAGTGVDRPDWPGFPAPWLHPAFRPMTEGLNVVFLSHAAALEDNVRFLAQQGPPVHVHVRDPRDALISLFEMGEQLGALQLLRFERCWPGYARLDRKGRIAALRMRVYPLYLRWIAGWAELADRNPGLVSFTTYEAFCADPDGIVSTLAASYGAAPGNSGELGTMHFRKGGVGTHREAISDADSRQMYDAIPVAVRERFGWRA